MVNKSKPASPWWTPDWEPWKANQSMVVLTLWPQPPRKIQAWNPFVVTCSTQIKAESCTRSNLFPWLIEANTLTKVPLGKLLLNDTDSQRKSSFFCMTSLPFWTPAVETKRNKSAPFVKMHYWTIITHIAISRFSAKCVNLWPLGSETQFVSN